MTQRGCANPDEASGPRPAYLSGGRSLGYGLYVARQASRAGKSRAGFADPPTSNRLPHRGSYIEGILAGPAGHLA